MFKTCHSITLLFNPNQRFTRDVVKGIGDYLQRSKVGWDVYFEENTINQLDGITRWASDGIIADCKDQTIQAAVQNLNVPVVGVGCANQLLNNSSDVPYVTTDNKEAIKLAYSHLKTKGIKHFAFYGSPLNDNYYWGNELENAILSLCQQDGYDCPIYRGDASSPETWQENMRLLAAWLQSLPSPVGIVSVSDVRGRHLLQACAQIGKVVPENVSIVGIDDDEITASLNPVGLSSVAHNYFEIGFQAAKLLHRRIDTPNLKNKVVIVPPSGVVQRQSSDFKALQDPYVMQAMHYIQLHACRGAKVEQVLDFVGVSRSNLEQRFKHERGHSIHAELHQTKLERACELLRTTEMSSQKIAQEAGYPSVQYMYAVFNKHFEQTPREYRQNNVHSKA
jgi:LacI family transcriptional regulator